jgi:CheY-like chemotaxis protein
MTHLNVSSDITSDMKQTNKKTILVVDDDPDIASVIRIWLEKHGFAAYEFTDPTLAFEYLRNGTRGVDLVLSDIRMPFINGYELVTKIKAVQPEIKVILMSAFDIRQEELLKVLPSMTIDGLISKPISMKKLAENINHILKADS